MSTLYRSTFRHEGKKYERTSTKSQREADRKADQLKKDLENGNIGISNKMRVKAWANEWLETYKKPNLAEKQYIDYKRQVDNHIVPQIGGLRLSEVKDIHLQKILNSKQGMSETRVKMLYLSITGIFSRAKQSRLIQHDPSEYLIMPTFTKGTHRSLTDFERNHFLKVAKTHRAGLMYKTMMYCGLRTGEVVALDWRHIDFHKHRLYVENAMKSGTDKIGEPKTKAGKRYIPIPDEIYFDLLDIRGDPFTPVFTRPNGSRHNESSRDAAWSSMRTQMDKSMGAVFEKRKAKDGKMRLTKVMSVLAPDFVPYCLRHTFCTDLQRKGVDLKMASYLMGHEDVSITAKIYTHVTDDMLDDTAKRIGVTNGVSCGKKSVQTA